MPRPQQQQPSPDSCVRSLARTLASSVLSSSCWLCLSWNSREKRKREREEARLLPPRGFSPLLKHTLSSCLLPLSLLLSSSLASFLVHFPLENVPRSHFLARRRPFSSSVLSPLTPSRRPDLFLVQLLSRTVANKCIECKLPTNFFHRFRACSPCACAGMYISIRRHLLSAFS